jgi:hypothetical protein
MTSFLTETLQGCVVRLPGHGQPCLVFVQHPNRTASRAVSMVTRDGETYRPIGPRFDWHGDASDDAVAIATEYLSAVKQS